MGLAESGGGDGERGGHRHGRCARRHRDSGDIRGFTVRDPVFVVSVASIEVTVTPSTLMVGQTARTDVVLRDAQGSIIINGPVITWRTSPEGVASVTSFGLVTGLKLGVTRVIASAEGRDGSAEITVIPAAVASVRISPTELALNVGDTGTLEAMTLDGNNFPLPGHAVTWTTNNPAVATIGGTASTPAGGTASIKAVRVGSTRIVATSDGKSASATVTVTAGLLLARSLTTDTSAPPNAPSPGGFSYGYTVPFAYIITVGWRDNSDNETEFQIERAVGGTNNFVLHATVPVAVRDGTGVRLTWEDNTAKEEGYRVDVALVGASGPPNIEATYNLPPNTTEFVAPGGAPGTKVFNQVTAYATVPGFGYFGSPFGLVAPHFTF